MCIEVIVYNVIVVFLRHSVKFTILYNLGLVHVAGTLANFDLDIWRAGFRLLVLSRSSSKKKIPLKWSARTRVRAL